MTKDPTSEFSSEPASKLSGDATSGAAAYADDTRFFGHPLGLSTLFFTELWERFSYYGMRALLILFMTAAVAEGGLGFDAAKAGAIYGLYTAFVYLTALPGGWVADRLIGQRNAVFYGGIIIAIGHFSMAIPAVTMAFGELPPFYAGLALIVIGTGLLKPNISTMVGELYTYDDDGGARRDAGFSVFYMGINLGAFAAPIITGLLGEHVNWHLGFAAAGLGMVLGLIVYKGTDRWLGDAGVKPNRALDAAGEAIPQKNNLLLGFGAAAALIVMLLVLQMVGVIDLSSAVGLASAAGILIVGIAIVYFAYMFLAGDLDPTERKRVGVIVVLFLFSVVFWSGFEQAGSSLNLFAERMTDRFIAGREVPASSLQSINSFWIITLSPAFAWLWVWLNRRNMEPSSPMKFAFGLIFLSAGFVVMIIAAARATSGELVSPNWLVLTYLLHTIGELALSPVGLSTVTKLAPQRMVGQMMGVWFMAISLGNLLGGQIAGLFETLPLPQLFGAVAVTTGAAGILLVVLAPSIRKMMVGVK